MDKAVRPVMNGTSQPHDRHDRHLVAALAADDLEPIVRTEAETLVASCHDCAELLADLRVIAAATAALPQIPRTRDFRITAADAARLRPTGWRGLLDALGGARASFTRPLAIGLTTLGLAGLLATTIPGVLSGGFGGAGAASPAPDSAAGAYSLASAAPALAGAPAPVASAAASAAPVNLASAAVASAGAPDVADVSSPAPSIGRTALDSASASPLAGGEFGAQQPGSKSGRGTAAGPSDASGSVADQNAGGGLPASTAGSTGSSLILLVSLVFLVAGLGLFMVRWGARRLARR